MLTHPNTHIKQKLIEQLLQQPSKHLFFLISVGKTYHTDNALAATISLFTNLIDGCKRFIADNADLAGHSYLSSQALRHAKGDWFITVIIADTLQAYNEVEDRRDTEELERKQQEWREKGKTWYQQNASQFQRLATIATQFKVHLQFKYWDEILKEAKHNYDFDNKFNFLIRQYKINKDFTSALYEKGNKHFNRHAKKEFKIPEKELKTRPIAEANLWYILEELAVLEGALAQGFLSPPNLSGSAFIVYPHEAESAFTIAKKLFVHCFQNQGAAARFDVDWMDVEGLKELDNTDDPKPAKQQKPIDPETTITGTSDPVVARDAIFKFKQSKLTGILIYGGTPSYSSPGTLLRQFLHYQVDPTLKPAYGFLKWDENSHVTHHEDLDDISKHFPLRTSYESSRIVVLWGIGGVGKSHHAQNFQRVYGRNYKLTIWVPVDDIDVFFKELGQALGITNKDTPSKEIRHHIKNWLEREENHGWLLFFDNAKDHDRLSPYLPTQGGDIVLTSCYGIWPRSFELVPINEPNQTDALVLFLNYLEEQPDNDDIDYLPILVNQTLGNLPLVIIQVAAYINKHKMSIREYLFLYQTQSHKLLNDVTFKELSHHKKAVFATFETSMCAIEETERSNHQPLVTREVITFIASTSVQNDERDIGSTISSLNAFLTLRYPLLNSVELLKSTLAELVKYALINSHERKIILNPVLMEILLIQKKERLQKEGTDDNKPFYLISELREVKLPPQRKINTQTMLSLAIDMFNGIRQLLLTKENLPQKHISFILNEVENIYRYLALEVIDIDQAYAKDCFGLFYLLCELPDEDLPFYFINTFFFIAKTYTQLGYYQKSNFVLAYTLKFIVLPNIHHHYRKLLFRFVVPLLQLFTYNWDCLSYPEFTKDLLVITQTFIEKIYQNLPAEFAMALLETAKRYLSCKDYDNAQLTAVKALSALPSADLDASVESELTMVLSACEVRDPKAERTGLVHLSHIPFILLLMNLTPTVTRHQIESILATLIKDTDEHLCKFDPLPDDIQHLQTIIEIVLGGETATYNKLSAEMFRAMQANRNQESKSTPLIIAAELGTEAVIQSALSALGEGASDELFRINKNDRTPFGFMMENEACSDAFLSNLLKQLTGKIKSLSLDDFARLLGNAALFRSLTIVNFILETSPYNLKLVINHHNKNGVNAFRRAVLNKQFAPAIVERFLEINEGNNYETIMSFNEELGTMVHTATLNINKRHGSQLFLTLARIVGPAIVEFALTPINNSSILLENVVRWLNHEANEHLFTLIAPAINIEFIRLDAKGRSLVHYAAWNPDPFVLNIILNKVKIDKSFLVTLDADGFTFLHSLFLAPEKALAHIGKCLEILGTDAVQVLTTSISDINPPIHEAVINKANGDLLLKILEILKADAKKLLMSCDKKKCSLLHLIVIYQDISVIHKALAILGKDAKKLLSQTDSSGFTPLHEAALSREKDVIVTLSNALGSQADPILKLPIYNKSNILHLAAENSDPDTFEFLLEKLGEEADAILLQQSQQGDTVLHVAARNEKCGSQIIPMIANRVKDKIKAMMVLLNNKGMTPLHHAAFKQNHVVVGFLLNLLKEEEAKAAIGKLNKDLMTPLHCACLNEQNGGDIIILFLKILGDKAKQLCMQKDASGNTPLHCAINCQDAFIVELIIAILGPEFELIATTKNKRGLTFLDFIFERERERPEVANVLITSLNKLKKQHSYPKLLAEHAVAAQLLAAFAKPIDDESAVKVEQLVDKICDKAFPDRGSAAEDENHHFKLHLANKYLFFKLNLPIPTVTASAEVTQMTPLSI